LSVPYCGERNVLNKGFCIKVGLDQKIYRYAAYFLVVLDFVDFYGFIGLVIS